MRKYMLLAAFGVLAASTSVYATDITAGTETGYGVEIKGVKTGETAKSIGRLSNNVSANFQYSDVTYAVITKHKTGNKEYGSSSGDTKLFYQDQTALVPSDPQQSDSSAFSGWSSL
jgi:hypothetical protein